MKRCYTDYPLFESEYGKEAPIREVIFLSYDGNKYCDILFDDQAFTVKAGYLYSEPKRLTCEYIPKKYKVKN